MAYEYASQGYTISDAGRRLVIDPITRIEGHLRCEVNINENNVVTNAVSCGAMFRGLETIVKHRDPRDIWAFTTPWLRCAPWKTRWISPFRKTPIPSGI